MPSIETPPDLRITVTDTRLAGHCVRGVKDWFEQKNLDFRSFIKDGIAAEDFLATEDALAERIVRLKLEREQNG
jgi:hypothetical protein